MEGIHNIVQGMFSSFDNIKKSEVPFDIDEKIKDLFQDLVILGNGSITLGDFYEKHSYEVIGFALLGVALLTLGLWKGGYLSSSGAEDEDDLENYPPVSDTSKSFGDLYKVVDNG